MVKIIYHVRKSCLILLTETYIAEREKGLRALPKRDGAYLPKDKAGGGDFWRKDGVGAIQVIDAVGHGYSALPLKALVMRFVELHSKSNRKEMLFEDIDKFLNSLPFESSQIDLLHAEVIEKENNKSYLKLEASGNPRVFIRHNDGSGRVDWGIPPSLIKKYKNQSSTVKPFPFDHYPQLGHGLLENEELSPTEIELAPKADVFIASDGLFEMKTGGDKTFQDQFFDFCEENKNLSSDEFREKILKIVYDQQAKDELEDDVTFLILHV